MEFVYIEEIKKMIEESWGGEIAICPFGKNGVTTKTILNQCYGINEIAIIDNYLKKWNPNILSVEDLSGVEGAGNWVILLNATDELVNRELETQIRRVLSEVKIINILSPGGLYCAHKKDFYLELKKRTKTKTVLGHELIRVGNMHDGGYIFLNDFKSVKRAYSFGIGGDISWETDLITMGAMDVFMYDPSVSDIPAYNSRFHFSSIGIAGKDKRGDNGYCYLSMESILRINGDLRNKNLILKMDVEGAEYEFIQNTEEELLDNFMQMSFEFHGFLVEGKREDIILRIFDKLSNTHFPVWVHANNNGRRIEFDNGILPDLLEITFVNKRLYEFGDKENSYPIALDSPNIPDREEIILGVW